MKKVLSIFVLFWFSLILAYPSFAETWTTSAAMPTARYGFATGVIGGKLYAVGGYDSEHVLGTLEIYSPATNTWTTGPNMRARVGLNAGVIGSKLYAVGGYDGKHALGTLEIYNPATNTWTTGAAMPTARSCFAAGVINGKLYAVGGLNDSHVLNTLEIYDPATNEWTTGPDMPTGRWALAAGVINGKLYAIGGYDGKLVFGTLEIYDPATNEWTTGPDMRACVSFAAGVIAGKLYAVGGLRNSGAENTLQIYDPTTNEWTTGPDMPTGRQGLDAGVIGGKLYTMGGGSDDKHVLGTLEIYNPATNDGKSRFEAQSRFPKPENTIGTMTDLRDGKTYKTVKIGNQTWMAENLNYYARNSWCNKCEIYGQLYTYESALNASPSGWHLPSDQEWSTLIDYLGGEAVAGGKLKATTGWNSPNTEATNSSGFSALPGGYFIDFSGQFVEEGSDANFWTRTPLDYQYACPYGLGHDNGKVGRGKFYRRFGCSVRCVKD